MPASWLPKCSSWHFLLKKLLSLLFQKPTVLPAALSSMLPKDLRSLAKITACPWLLLNLLRGTGHQDSVVSWKHCDNCICYAGILLANLLHVRDCGCRAQNLSPAIGRSLVSTLCDIMPIAQSWSWVPWSSNCTQSRPWHASLEGGASYLTHFSQIKKGSEFHIFWHGTFFPDYVSCFHFLRPWGQIQELFTGVPSQLQRGQLLTM